MGEEGQDGKVYDPLTADSVKCWNCNVRFDLVAAFPQRSDGPFICDVGRCRRRYAVGSAIRSRANTQSTVCYRLRADFEAEFREDRLEVGL